MSCGLDLSMRLRLWALCRSLPSSVAVGELAAQDLAGDLAPELGGRDEITLRSSGAVRSSCSPGVSCMLAVEGPLLALRRPNRVSRPKTKISEA